MPPLGVHMSIAGGYHLAVERARAAGCDCVQLFTKNNNQWRAKPIAADEAQRFRDALAECGVGHPLSHDSYLINLASPNQELWQKSLDSFVVELERAAQLGIPYVVTHPGSHTTASEDEGIAQIVRAIDTACRATARLPVGILLENTAGQGTALGWRLEHLGSILSQLADPRRVGVCIDTCHLLAAGYPMGTKRQYDQTMDEIDRCVGVGRIKALHLNDSKKPLGSRVDRHEHIGRGCLGLEPFRRLLNDPRLADVPMYLETPKGTEDGVDLDVMNLQTLRSLVRRRRSRR
jgi:deoxyribonuclease IV